MEDKAGERERNLRQLAERAIQSLYSYDESLAAHYRALLAALDQEG